ncbi:MAG: hypothetical protein KJ558_04720 [Gammaproteobacteria bacterium]|nr:hypothetical protein [Gammaproteobacteria bacterium]MBU1961661.1 hypothetical protein [Gammaproteobacteria bacterium]
MSASQGKKITHAVRNRLPKWIKQTVKPVIEQALVASGLQAELSLAGKEGDQLFMACPATKTGTGYAAATIRLEFGGPKETLERNPSGAGYYPRNRARHGRGAASGEIERSLPMPRFLLSASAIIPPPLPPASR